MAKMCSEADCDKPMRARGLCSTHYNRTRYTPEQRHTVVEVPCGWCGKTCIKSPDRSRGYGERFCSYECRDDMRAHRARPDHPRLLTYLTRSHPVHPDYMAPGTDLVRWVPAPLRPAPAAVPKPRYFTAGRCWRCGGYFVAFDPARTANSCSPKCAKAIGRDRRRAHQRDAYVMDVRREDVYRRDGYRCKICGRKVRLDKAVPHPLAPTLDHIIPLSAGVEAGGIHAPSNVQCAHYLCNSIKSATQGTVQLALF